MSGVNKVIIVGNLGNDPETRYTQAGAAITNISVATSEKWKDKNTGQESQRVEWHKIAFFGKLAEIAGQYLKKGSKVYVEGSLRTRKWQDQNGNDRYSTEIVASEMQMLDAKGDNAQQQQQPQRQANASPYANVPNGNAPRTGTMNQNPRPQVGAHDFSDDVPPF